MIPCLMLNILVMYSPCVQHLFFLWLAFSTFSHLQAARLRMSSGSDLRGFTTDKLGPMIAKLLNSTSNACGWANL